MKNIHLSRNRIRPEDITCDVLGLIDDERREEEEEGRDMILSEIHR